MNRRLKERIAKGETCWKLKTRPRSTNKQSVQSTAPLVVCCSYWAIRDSLADHGENSACDIEVKGLNNLHVIGRENHVYVTLALDFAAFKTDHAKGEGPVIARDLKSWQYIRRIAASLNSEIPHHPRLRSTCAAKV